VQYPLHFPPLEWDVFAETDRGEKFICSFRTREEAEWAVEVLLSTPRAKEAPPGTGVGMPLEGVVVKAELRRRAPRN
jgi:hypothetical protein